MEYGTKILTIQNHPVRDYITANPIPQERLVRTKTSSLKEFTRNLQELKTSYNQFPSIPMKNFYNYKTITINSSLADSKKQDQSPVQWQSQYKYMIQEKYPKHHLVFTDGTVRDNKSACAIYNESFNILNRMKDSTTIFTAELQAIYLAIQFILSHIQGGQFLILTDSLSAVRSLQNLNITKHYLVSKIATVLQNITPSKITIEWVPSHMGIQGNEKADKLAAEATKLSRINELQIPHYQVKGLIKKLSIEEWNRKIRAIDPAMILNQTQTSPTPYTTESRRTQVILTRLRLNTTKLTHGHHFTKTPPKICSSCNERVTIQHVLLDCPVLNDQRRPIIAHCIKNNLHPSLEDILSPPFPAKIIIDFLEAIGINQEI